MGCIVLGGGGSVRFGSDKSLETIGGKTLLERVVTQVGSLAHDIMIVGAKNQPGCRLKDFPDVKITSDIHPGTGPLGGIYTGLAMSSSSYNLVVACDMPFLNRALLRYMFAVSSGFDVVLPRVGDLIEPLHAIYQRTCFEPIEDILRGGKRRVRELFERVNVRYVDADEIDRFDPDHLSFFNINTEADLIKARQLESRVRQLKALK